VFENSNVGSDHQQLCMQILQSVARRYGLVCLLHEKPFAGVNGSGKHNNWSFGTDTGVNLLEPGATPHENLQFLFFCTAVLAAVDKHQELLRASIASPGQDHRLGANEAPPAIISIFLGAELQKVYDAIESGSGDAATPSSYLKLGASVLPHLPMHGGDRNRTSPFAFTGNKFEFRALGSSMSPGLPNTVLNTIAAQAFDQLSDSLEAQLEGGAEVAEAVLAVVKDAYGKHKRIVFNGDNYTEEWHAEADARGLSNLRQTPDALPALISPSAVEVMGNYDVLSQRELESRYEVFVEQYVAKLNIEAETTFSMAKTMLLPAAVRYLGELAAAGESGGLATIASEVTALVDEFVAKIADLGTANANHPEPDEILDHAKYVQDTVVPAMAAVREIADELESIVPDALWPLPKYSEILFIK
jgi:glutamine synthetase